MVNSMSRAALGYGAGAAAGAAAATATNGTIPVSTGITVGAQLGGKAVSYITDPERTKLSGQSPIKLTPFDHSKWLSGDQELVKNQLDNERTTLNAMDPCKLMDPKKESNINWKKVAGYGAVAAVALAGFGLLIGLVLIPGSHAGWTGVNHGIGHFNGATMAWAGVGTALTGIIGLGGAAMVAKTIHEGRGNEKEYEKRLTEQANNKTKLVNLVDKDRGILFNEVGKAKEKENYKNLIRKNNNIVTKDMRDTMAERGHDSDVLLAEIVAESTAATGPATKSFAEKHPYALIAGSIALTMAGMSYGSEALALAADTKMGSVVKSIVLGALGKTAVDKVVGTTAGFGWYNPVGYLPTSWTQAQ